MEPLVALRRDVDQLRELRRDTFRQRVRGPADFGNVRETFAKFIRNGETVVSVGAATNEEVEFAAATLRQYSLIAIELAPLSTGSEIASSSPDRSGNAQ